MKTSHPFSPPCQKWRLPSVSSGSTTIVVLCSVIGHSSWWSYRPFGSCRCRRWRCVQSRRWRLYCDGLCQKGGDLGFAETQPTQDFSGVLTECRGRPVEPELEIAQTPERADLLQFAPFSMRVGGHETERAVQRIVEERLALIEA